MPEAAPILPTDAASELSRRVSALESAAGTVDTEGGPAAKGGPSVLAVVIGACLVGLIAAGGFLLKWFLNRKKATP